MMTVAPLSVKQLHALAERHYLDDETANALQFAASMLETLVEAYEDEPGWVTKAHSLIRKEAA